MKKLLALLVGAALLTIPAIAQAATTADITVTATPQLISISVGPTSYDFGTVSPSDTPYTSTTYFSLNNTSNVQTDQTISVTDLCNRSHILYCYKQRKCVRRYNNIRN